MIGGTGDTIMGSCQRTNWIARSQTLGVMLNEWIVMKFKLGDRVEPVCGLPRFRHGNRIGTVIEVADDGTWVGIRTVSGGARWVRCRTKDLVVVGHDDDDTSTPTNVMPLRTPAPRHHDGMNARQRRAKRRVAAGMFGPNRGSPVSSPGKNLAEDYGIVTTAGVS